MKVEWFGDEINRMVEGAIIKGLTESALIIEAEAVLNCPVHDSMLRNSIYHNVSHGNKTARVGASADYSASVEYGRRPGKRPPVDALKKWAKDKLGDEKAAFALSKKIAREGTQPHPFLRPALDNNILKFESLIGWNIKSVLG